MYGNEKSAFLFHIPTKKPDFLQVLNSDPVKEF